jgi:hypothetical protein
VLTSIGKFLIQIYVSDFSFKEVYLTLSLLLCELGRVIFVKRKERLAGQAIYTVNYLYVSDQIQYLLTVIKCQLIVFLKMFSKKFDLITDFILIPILSSVSHSYLFFLSVEGPHSRCYRRTAALRFIVQPL